MTALRLALGGMLAALVFLVAGAAPAGAHAVLLSSSPADRAVLAEAPATIELVFNEPVSVGDGGVRVVDGNGQAVLTGPASVTDHRVSVPLDGLDDGAYIVSYRVISADSHPVRGAFSFSVGDAAAAPDDAVAAALAGGGDRAWELAGTMARALAFFGVLLASGAAAFVVLAHDGAADRALLVRVVAAGAAVGVVGLAADVVSRAALASGAGFGAAVDGRWLRQALGDGVGAKVAVAAVALGVTLAALRRPLWRWPTAAAAMTAAAAFAFAGHARVSDPRWLAVSSNAVHTAAAALWFGGVVALAVLIFARRRAGAGATLGPLVARFSTVATVAVVAVGAAGAGLAWTEVRTLDALTTTDYGRLLLLKLVVVGFVAALGTYNHLALVPQVGQRAGAARRLGTTVSLEASALVLAVGMTALLVNETPAREAAAVDSIVDATVALGDGSVNVVVEPARRGTNVIHLYLFDARGGPLEPEAVTIESSLPDHDIGPLSKPPFPAGPGHFQVDEDFGVAGRWELRVLVRPTRFEEHAATVDILIRS